MHSTQAALANGHYIQIENLGLHLLPEKAVYIEALGCLLVSDIHLGKSETFQAFGIPIPSATNQDSLSRLQLLCDRLNPEKLVILGDLFHSKQAMTVNVVDEWVTFVNSVNTDIHLIVGNHDRSLKDDLDQLLMTCHWEGVLMETLWLTHDPLPYLIEGAQVFNICGHIHPCLRLKTKLDDIRLPCFYLDESQCQLTLPSFGAFTGGYEISLHQNTTAYGIVESSIVPFEGKARR